jgi:hypothetical protein
MVFATLLPFPVPSVGVIKRCAKAKRKDAMDLPSAIADGVYVLEKNIEEPSH